MFQSDKKAMGFTLRVAEKRLDTALKNLSDAAARHQRQQLIEPGEYEKRLNEFLLAKSIRNDYREAMKLW